MPTPLDVSGPIALDPSQAFSVVMSSLMGLASDFDAESPHLDPERVRSLVQALNQLAPEQIRFSAELLDERPLD